MTKTNRALTRPFGSLILTTPQMMFICISHVSPVNYSKLFKWMKTGYQILIHCLWRRKPVGFVTNPNNFSWHNTNYIN